MSKLQFDLNQESSILAFACPGCTLLWEWGYVLSAQRAVGLKDTPEQKAEEQYGGVVANMPLIPECFNW